MPINAQMSGDGIGEVNFLELVLRRDEVENLKVEESEDVRPRQWLFLN